MRLAPMIAVAIANSHAGEFSDEALERDWIRESLEKLADLGGTEFVAEMVELLRTQTAVQVNQLEVAHSSGDLATAQRLAHSMKSSFGNFGARGLQMLAYEME